MQRLVKVITTVGRLLPVSVLPGLFGAIGSIVPLFVTRERRIADAQIRFAMPQLSDGERKNLIGRVFSHIVRATGEFICGERVFMSLPDSNSPLPQFRHIGSTSNELAASLIDRRTSLVALSGHIGSFELLAAYWVKCGIKVSAFGRSPNNKLVGRFLDSMRKHFGVETIWREDRKSASKLLTAIREGHALACLIDQDVDLDNIYTPFFGLNAASPVSPIVIAMKYKLPIVVTFIVRVSSNQHMISLEFVDYDPEDSDTPRKVMEIYNQRLEELIRKYPDQWVWFHRRWRRRPGVDYSAPNSSLPTTPEYINWLAEQRLQS